MSKSKFSWDRTAEEIEADEKRKREEDAQKEAEKQAWLAQLEEERIEARKSAQEAAKNREAYGYKIVTVTIGDYVTWEIWTTDEQTEYIIASGRTELEEAPQAIDAKVAELVKAGKIKDETIELTPAPRAQAPAPTAKYVEDEFSENIVVATPVKSESDWRDKLNNRKSPVQITDEPVLKKSEGGMLSGLSVYYRQSGHIWVKDANKNTELKYREGYVKVNQHTGDVMAGICYEESSYPMHRAIPWLSGATEHTKMFATQQVAEMWVRDMIYNLLAGN